MRRFSIGTALGDGFALMARRPLAVFVWGLLMAAPVFAIFAAMMPTLGAITAMSVDAGADSAEMPPELFAQMMQFQAASMLGNLGQMLAMVVVYTAVMRAILRPAESSFLSLRVGMDEVRVAVVGLAIGVGLYMLIMVAVMVGVAFGFAFWGSGMEPGPGLALAIVLVLALVLAICWGLARVSLIAPASVLDRDFAFARGWRLANGKAWPLLGMMILIMLILMLFQILLLAVTLALLFAVFGAGGAPDLSSAVDPFADLLNWFSAHWYVGVAAAVLGSLFYGVTITLSVAPFASACRQLAQTDRTPEASPAPAA